MLTAIPRLARSRLISKERASRFISRPTLTVRTRPTQAPPPPPQPAPKYPHIGSGKLEANELIEPLLEMLSPLMTEGGKPPPTPEQCLGFGEAGKRQCSSKAAPDPPHPHHKLTAAMFDQDGDGVISIGEFYFLIEFTFVMHVLQALAKDEASAPLAGVAAAAVPLVVREYLDGSYASALMAGA